MEKQKYIFYYEIYDGTKGSEELELTNVELREMCIKLNCDCDLVWWDYEEV